MGQAHVCPASEEAAAVGLPPFHREEDGAGPLASYANALHDSQECQRHASPDADDGVVGHQADARRGYSHGEQGCYEGGLAAVAIAEVTEDDATQRPGTEADEVCRERDQATGQRVCRREVELGEDERGTAAVKEEVVPLDGRADCARHHRTNALA